MNIHMSRPNARTRARALAGTLVFAAAIALCAPAAAAADECPHSANRATFEDGAFTCECPEDWRKGTVWGIGPYTLDSSICEAALHAGVIESSGGTVSLRSSPGCEQYPEGTANGVATQDWGHYESSFYFEGLSGVCTETVHCPRNFSGHRGKTEFFACLCVDVPRSGSVWGTGIYTDDSNICRAARHAGAISEKGGAVTLLAKDGCQRYQGSTANEIESSNWGQYPASYTFATSPQACSE